MSAPEKGPHGKQHDAEAPGRFGPKYDHDIPEGHRTAETCDVKPDDSLLRRHGFAIVARPKAGEPKWARKGQLYLQRDALKIARGEPEPVKPTEKKLVNPAQEQPSE